jgi:type I restriction enzyme S subunit
MGLRERYKQTEVGVIPEDWDVKTIRDVCTIFGRIGFRGYTKNDIVKEGYGAISLSPSNIIDGKLTFDSCTYISWFKYEESPEIKILIGDVLLVKTGSTFGKVAYVHDLKEKATINPQIIVFKQLKINNLYFGYLLNFSIVQNQVNSAIVGGAIPTLSQKHIYCFNIPVPSTYEQQAIATAISDIDGLIISLHKLIDKKKKIKEGAMNELLTGKRRLRGYSDEWVHNELREHLKFQVGFPFSSSYFHQEKRGIRLIKNRDLKTDDQVFHYSGPYDKQFIVSNGDVLIGMDGDFIPCVWDKGKALLNQRVGRLIVEESINQNFIRYALIGPLEEIQRSTFATTVKHLSHNDVENLVVSLPPTIEEQTAIANILSDMDSEIESLGRKLNKYKDIKKGMMQELLTGRIRLLEEENQ